MARRFAPRWITSLAGPPASTGSGPPVAGGILLSVSPSCLGGLPSGIAQRFRLSGPAPTSRAAGTVHLAHTAPHATMARTPGTAGPSDRVATFMLLSQSKVVSPTGPRLRQAPGSQDAASIGLRRQVLADRRFGPGPL